MSLRTCDFCNEKKHCKSYSRKQLQGREKQAELIPRTDEKGNPLLGEGGMPLFDKFTKWTNKFTKQGFLYNEFQKLEEKHKFGRKTRICKDCINQFPLLKNA